MNVVWVVKKLVNMGFLEFFYRAKQTFRSIFLYAAHGRSKVFHNNKNEIPHELPNVNGLPDYNYCAESILYLEFFGRKIKKTGDWPTKFPDSGELVKSTKHYMFTSPAKYDGAIKNYYEINKLYHLPRLALAFNSSKDVEYYKSFNKDLEYWSELNPFLLGMNWKSGLEVSIRLINILISLHILSSSSNIDLTSYKKCITRHLSQIKTVESKFTSRGNHTVVELVGQMMGELFMLQFNKVNKRVIENLADKLTKEIVYQVNKFGSGTEDSFTYNILNVECCLWGFIILHKAEITIPEEMIERIRIALDFILTMCDEYNNAPRYGDDDSASLVKIDKDSDLGTSGRIHNIISLASSMGMCGVKNRNVNNFDYLLKLYSLPQLPSRKLASIKSKQAVYNYDDRIVCLNDNESMSKLVILTKDYSHPPFFGHAHSDCNSIWWSFRGEPILTDPGSYSYTRELELRDYLRSVKSHNTFFIDGVDDSKFISPFVQEPNFRSRVLSVENKHDSIMVRTERTHVNPADLCAQRNIDYKPNRIVVLDKIIGDSEGRSINQSFIFFHKVRLLEVCDEHMAMFILGSAKIKLTTTGFISDKTSILDGRCSDRINQIIKSPRIETHGRGGEVKSTIEIIV